MNEYRFQQLRAAELIEQGATAEQIAEVFNWTKTRAAPEQIETGDKRTLTPRRKCGIIKAMRRHVRRWKRKQEEKTMLNDFTLLDGSTIEIVSLGRDDGAEIIGRDPAGQIVCYIATESTTQDRAAIMQAIKDGVQTLEQVFDMWENGLGGNPFDLDYLPEYYK
jgi:hypothetical protein